MASTPSILPERDDFLRLSRQGNVVPVYADLMADFETPVSVYDKLSQSGPAFLLESIEGGAILNRYSFIGCQPRKILSIGERETEVQYRHGKIERFPTPSDPLTLIEDEMRALRPVRLEGMPRFVGGAVGYIGYEYVHRLEPTVARPPRDPLGMPMMHFLLTDTVVIFDRARQVLRILVNAWIEDDAEAAYAQAVQQIVELAAKLEKGREVPTMAVGRPPAQPLPAGNFSQERFEAMVEACKEYIRAGDIIQVVGAQRFEIPFERSPLELYRALRVVNPSPYMFLYNPGPFSLVGASPEVHVRLTDGLAELRPIAGTRPRGGSNEADQAFERELLADEKECAEHLMLVDLARNDLGRVCQYGSVTVPEFMVVERYSHVMHIVSQVEGRIRPDQNACDLVRATFPAGTVSGAPKVRAMQIISEMEQEFRGPYAGAMAYFSYDGNLDSCICIRTGVLQDGKLFLQAGAGLVADSVPQNEYQETISKATGMLRAVALAQSMGR